MAGAKRPRLDANLSTLSSAYTSVRKPRFIEDCCAMTVCILVSTFADPHVAFCVWKSLHVTNVGVE
jgi:hypothetical protein